MNKVVLSKQRFLRKTGLNSAAVTVKEDVVDDVAAYGSFAIQTTQDFTDREQSAVMAVRIAIPWELDPECDRPYNRDSVVRTVEEMGAEANEWVNNCRELARMLNEAADVFEISAARIMSRTIDRMAEVERAAQEASSNS